MTVPYTVGVDGDKTILLVNVDSTTITLQMNRASTLQLIRLLEATINPINDDDEDWVEDQTDGA
jgi:hypothetical protein